MDGLPLELPLFLFATFAGALVAGLSGFAFGLVAASIWLYILTPLQTATLIIAFGLIVQGYAVWKLRRALDWQNSGRSCLAPRSACPLGVCILTWANPAHVRIGRRRFSGSLQPLCAVSSRDRPGEGGRRGGRRRRRIPQRRARRHHRACRNPRHHLVRLRGWPKDVQRTVFQPVAVAIFLMSALWIGAKGAITAETKTVPDRTARAARRHLARPKAVRPPRRGGVPQGRAGAALASGACPDDLARSPGGADRSRPRW